MSQVTPEPDYSKLDYSGSDNSGYYLVKIQYDHEIDDGIKRRRLPEKFEAPSLLRFPIVPRVGDKYFWESEGYTALFRVTSVYHIAIPHDASEKMVATFQTLPAAMLSVEYMGH